MDSVHATDRPRPPRRCDLLLTGGHVVTVDDDRNVYEPGAVAVLDGRIAAVGPAAVIEAAWQGARTLDCRGRAVLPGFVDGHNHLFQALARGLGEGQSIWPWLCAFMWPYSIAVDPDDARVAATLGAVEALRAGITTVVDHHYAPTDAETVLSVADAIEAAGLRGVVARGMIGHKTAVAAARGLPDALFRHSVAEELDITRDCMQRRPRGSAVEIWPAPLNLSYVDQELVRGAVELARTHDTRWHTHCSEGAKDPASYLDAYGIRPVTWLAAEGLLDERATLAHAIWLDDDEVKAVGERGAGIAHNPSSNAYLASGVMPLRRLRDAGAVVALGTDGPSAGHRQDMFETMKQTLFAQRLDTLDPAVARCEEALELATREGGRYVGSGAGTLAPGARADLAVVDLDRPHLRPLHRAVAALVYSARGGDVETTVVGGRVVVEHGRCTLVDEDALLAEAQERAERLVNRAGFGPLTTPWRH
ncbi:amidohydrolase family protein [Streptomyces sp. VRA16 Mangrove soil]|uniref:amidohydrolase family protein n=1 Tax=Streptomyces sp. VRA16 Mangrove soil TaxID=2817434 RepID=UPI001A9FEBBD|nr:amidohydrolase family protein [Streptomyces sp. VRA16 Mangrove soil]MBO1331554.1 amidohydrolase family protein [Streptomyces sp. VRA16 Mangrove soil]